MRFWDVSTTFAPHQRWAWLQSQSNQMSWKKPVNLLVLSLLCAGRFMWQTPSQSLSSTSPSFLLSTYYFPLHKHSTHQQQHQARHQQHQAPEQHQAPNQRRKQQQQQQQQHYKQQHQCQHHRQQHQHQHHYRQAQAQLTTSTSKR